MKYDIIIIGAGLGGLTAGAKLSKEGKKVLLIEQHDRPGGYATTFKRGNFILEVGLHEMYGPAPGDIKSKIFQDLDVFRHVEFIPLDEFYRFTNGRFDMTITHDPLVTAERLSGIFPGDAGGIKAYFDQILQPKKKVFEGGQDRSLGEFLDSIITNEDLKLILLGNLGYFHDDPYSLSLSYYSISQGSYFTGGASFIKGGSQKLSDHLSGFIKDHGGEVLLNHVVTRMKTDNHNVTGVLFTGKNDRGLNIREASADEIIANNSMPGVADLLPDEYGTNLKNSIKDQDLGASLLTLYLGFKKPVRELGYKNYSTFIYDPSVKSQRDILKNNRDDFSVRNFTFIDYGQVDSGLAPAGKSVGTICCIDYLKDWEGLERKTYLERKEKVASILIERLEKLIPGVKNSIEYHEVGTPYTCKRFTLNAGGAVYGFAQTPSRKAIDTSNLPDNLHFASAWGKTGGGFSGAIYGGYLCAINILRKKIEKR
jgi:phytoene dehydrogenase-like protein